MMLRKAKRLISLALLTAMALTMGAAAANRAAPPPPIDTQPVHKTLSDGTDYNRWYAGYSYGSVYLDEAISAAGVATGIGDLLGIPIAECLDLGVDIMEAVRSGAIDYGYTDIGQHKYIETRQKPGDISPVYTTIYYVYIFGNDGSVVASDTITYEAMNPYVAGAAS